VTAASRFEALTDERLLKRNVGLNLVGWALPAAAAIGSIPLLARGLGPTRFGLIGIAWAAVGIFSLFDFGLGRALTRMVAERLVQHRDDEISDLVWSASWVLLGLTHSGARGGRGRHRAVDRRRIAARARKPSR
jgi:hypothetical protein